VVKIVFKFFIIISCFLIFRGLVAEPLLDGADFDYGEYLSGQCLTCHQSSSDEGIPAINGAEALYIAKKLILYKNKELENEVMQLVASALDKEQIASLAIYFNSLEK
jgi:cytochrome c